MAKSKSKTNKISKNEIVVGVIVAVILGFGGGFIIGANSGAKDNETETADVSHAHSKVFTVSTEEAPSVQIVVTEDAKSGYNIHLETDKFKFTPENVNEDDVTGQGHAHLYVDDVKIGRLYGPDFHYNEDFEGTKTFKVTLNANNHDPYSADGVAVEATMKVTHDSDDANHSH